MATETNLLLALLSLFPVAFTQTNQSEVLTSSCAIPSPFYCANGDGCIRRDFFCDGVNDCSDGSDEIPFNVSMVDEMAEGIRCSWRRHRRGLSSITVRHCFLPSKYLCDHQLDCFFGNDESNCFHTFQCSSIPSRFRQYADKQYRVRVQFCDNIQNCFDGSDEIKYKPDDGGFQCPITKTRITTKCVLPEHHVCDGINDCDDGTDECRCNAELTEGYSNDRCFQCLDETLVVPQRQVCDEKFHCSDLSDECLCPRVSRPKLCDQLCQVGQDCGSCQVGQIICQQGDNITEVTCINRTSVCDRRLDCPMGEDEQNCHFVESQFFRCFKGASYIPLHQYCDNCTDGSDEQNCERFYTCESYDERAGYKFATPFHATKCDKIPECEDLDDECEPNLCTNTTFPTYCNYVVPNYGFICPITNCAIIGKEVCDGYPTCNETSPQHSADEFDCHGRFYCSDKGAIQLPIHVSLSQTCNTISDCYDASDEMGCSNETHFYCHSGSPSYIKRSQVCNGKQDCQTGEDECQNCVVSPFSSDKSLIQSYVLQTFLWIVGIFAATGNIVVILQSSVQLYRDGQTLSHIAHNHRIFIISLASADFLMGVYLISLGSVNSTYSGIYCQKDIQWRASRPCIALGTIAVISIECSVFLLTIMATYRLLLAMTPFKSHVRRRFVYLSVIGAWIASVILATIPSLPSTTLHADYFLSEVWYKNNPYLTTVKQHEAKVFTTNLWSLQKPNSGVFYNETDLSSRRPLTWERMISSISQLNANYTPDLFYGYYSAHGVCLPRIFPNPSTDRSWSYSLFLIILNFSFYIWIIVAYIGIYKATVKRSKQAGRISMADSTTMHHRITRIIITNIFCWFPICILGFIGVGGNYLSPEAYAVSAIVILPINSAFNPFLFSDLPDLLWKCVKPVHDIARIGYGRWKASIHKTSSTRSTPTNSTRKTSKT